MKRLELLALVAPMALMLTPVFYAMDAARLQAARKNDQAAFAALKNQVSEFDCRRALNDAQRVIAVGEDGASLSNEEAQELCEQQAAGQRI